MNYRPHDSSDDAFDEVINSGYTENPYGPPTIPANSIPRKPGLTRRGKVAMTVGVTVLATGGMLTWQHYQAESKASEAQAQEIQYKRDLLALEMQKELNKAASQNQKTTATANSTRQKQIDACVADNKGLVGKQLGTTLASVVSDCQAQYPSVTGTDAMQQTASTTGAGGGGGISPGLLLGLAAGGGLLVAVAANRNKKNYSA